VRQVSCARRSALRSLSAIVWIIIVVASGGTASAQSVPYQRAFPQSKAIVEKHLKELQSSSAGRLPMLDGFTVPGDLPLDRFRRGYYQCVALASSTPSGESMVRVKATITAWYADPVSAKSGYKVLPSNGRLEADFLDRLQEALGGQVLSSGTTPVANSPPSPLRNQSHGTAPTLSAPTPGDSAARAQPKAGVASPFKLASPLSVDNMPSLATQKAMVDRQAEEQTKEAKGLEEILRNQVHPGNLVAVKKRDAPVLASPSEDAKVLFLAAPEDEFEILDVNPNWVHVRISGLSRGWIRRSSLEMLTVEPDPQPAETQAHTEPAPTDTQPFHVENEEVASFPGNWAPLQGRTVRIVSVQKADDNASITGPSAKLTFAKSFFDREYADLVKTSTSIAGVVMIFDSEDGGMVAATLPAMRQWKSGTLSDEAFLRRCFFDPPEAFGLVHGP
jgi:hypothetical protein